MTVRRDSEIPASGWWCCSLNRPSWSLLWKLYICSLGSLVHLPQKITWLGLILHLDLYSNVNSLGIPVLTPQLKIVTLHRPQELPILVCTILAAGTLVQIPARSPSS